MAARQLIVEVCLRSEATQRKLLVIPRRLSGVGGA